MENESVQVMHSLPGRVRLKVARLKGDPGLARLVEERLSQVPAIRQVEARALTGSLLVLYDPETIKEPASLLPLSETLGQLFPEIDLEQLPRLLEPPPVPAGGAASTLSVQITQMFSALNSQVAAATGGLADLKSLVPLALIILGLRAILSSDKLNRPAWYDYFWFGLSIFVMLNRQLWEEPGDRQPSS